METQSSFSAAAWAFKLLTEKPERTLLIVGGKRINASLLSEEVATMRASIVQSGIGRDGVVAVAAERTQTAVATVLACLIEGVTPFVVDPRQDHELLAKLLDAIRVHGLHGGNSLDVPAFRARLPYLKWTGELSNQKRTTPPETGSDSSFYLHTAGTCALPRAMQHPVSAIEWQSRALTSNLKLKPGTELWFTGSLSAPSVFALGLCATLSSGGILVLDDPLTHLAGASRVTEGNRILLLSQASDLDTWNAEKLPSIKGRVSSVMVTDCVLPEKTALTFMNATDALVWTGYSAAECAGFLTTNTVPGVWPSESAGRTIGGSEIAVIGADGKRLRAGQQGRIVYQLAPAPQKVTSLTFQTRSESATTATSPGDWGCIDENDYLFIAGCDKSTFGRAGFILNAPEIEHRLKQLPQISDVVVFAAPNDEIENDVAAAIVPGNGTIDFSAVLQSLSADLPRYMLPDRLSVVESLPRTPTGKMKRFGYVVPPRTATPAQIDNASEST